MSKGSTAEFKGWYDSLSSWPQLRIELPALMPSVHLIKTLGLCNRYNLPVLCPCSGHVQRCVVLCQHWLIAVRAEDRHRAAMRSWVSQKYEWKPDAGKQRKAGKWVSSWA